MTSLTAFNRLPQLRMIPVQGTPLFRYERRISNRWVPCNHSRAAAIVGVYYRKAKRLCAKLTEGSKTTTACPSVLFAGSQKRGALSTCARTMNTVNVSARSSSFSASSGR
nr:MAG TPA: hypothetical protein [Caudoviricetes sp.]